ncbi:histidine triad (HIT) family protein [Balneicella halophila]|uniref:Histidine triad (HIT) family protein n=1 Tax=Balneicella halophila TaxID=1537566 RepID=A0A7L4UT23_BALHA|nr:HIT family protein [Balneicella halophila]PVX52437.1 histidine triad (HIT) family protein [Balneicella halophila]
MATIFTKIINGEIPSYKIAEDDKYYAFLDINPIAEGHVLVVPKIENDYIFNLEDELLGGLMVFAKKVAKAIDKSIDCKRVGVAVVGLEVPHTHVHLIPLQGIDSLSFSNPKLDFTEEEFKAIQKKITENI